MRLTDGIFRIANRNPTPFLIIDLGIIRKNYREIKKNIDDVEVFYAIKANDHPKILEVLILEGSSFEISSLNELRRLIKLKVPPSKIMCLNPIKNSDFLCEMNNYGVELMVYDSIHEVDKIAKYAPQSKLILRITVSNEGSSWPLTRKFGVDPSEAMALLKYARKKKLRPIGLTFHVGSQCLNKNNWASALYVCHDLWLQAKEEDIEISLISLGGGIPAHHVKDIPSVKDIGDSINNTLEREFKKFRKDIRLTIEPGRGIVGDAGIMVTRVVGKAKRGNEDWIYIDVGVFNGLMETIEGIGYDLKTEHRRKNKNLTVAGPSCDSVDIPFKNVIVWDIEEGEFLYIMNAGAYTTVYAAPFNGFEVPKVVFINN